jgi:hypothetical protein
MAKKLSSWERAQRAREKRDARDEAASHRAGQRAQARQEREWERARLRDEREEERRAKQTERDDLARSKKRRKEEQLEAWRQEVEDIQGFLAGLARLHARPFDLAELQAQFAQRAGPRPLPKRTFTPGTPQAAHQTRTIKRLIFDEVSFEDSPGSEKAATAATLAGLGGVALLGGVIAASMLPDQLLVGVGASVVGIAFLVFGLVRKKNLVEAHKAEQREALKAHQELDAARTANHKADEAARKAEHEARAVEFTKQEAARLHGFRTVEGEAATHWATQEANRNEVMEKAFIGDVVAVELICEALLPLRFEAESPWDPVTTLEDYEVGYAVPDGRTVELLLHLPHPTVVPDRTAEMNSADTRIQYKKLTKTASVETYDAFVGSFALHHAIATFEACPSIQTVVVEACLVVADEATGEDREDGVLWAVYSRDLLARVRVERVDAIGMLENAEHEHKPRKSRSKKQMEPRISREKLTWATLDDEEFDLPPGLIDPSEGERLPNPHTGPDASERNEDDDRAAMVLTACIVHILSAVASIDGSISDEEIDAITVMVGPVAEKMIPGFDPKELRALLSRREPTSAADVESRAHVLAETVPDVAFQTWKMGYWVALSDGEVADEERDFLFDLGGWLGLDGDDMKRGLQEMSDDMNDA